METFKILIADDEYWSREKLRKMIDWQSYGLTLLEPAKDGEEVLARMGEEQPDILITDIDMPFLSGVDLLLQIRENYPDTIPFVISGYADFDYVRGSFMAGSINYLVKPVSRIDLVNAIAKALDLVARRDAQKKEARQRQDEFLKASSLMQDREFSQLLEQRKMPRPANIIMNSKVDFTGAKLMLIKIHDMSDLADEFHYDMNLLSFRLKQKMKEMIKSNDVVIFNYIYRSNEFILLLGGEDEALAETAKKLDRGLGQLTSSPVSIVINDSICTMDNIYQAYVQSVALLMTRNYTMESVVIRCGQKEEKTEGERVCSRISEAQVKELRTLWKTGNKKAIRKMVFDNIGMRNCSKQQWQYLEVKQTVRRLVNTWEEVIIGNHENQNYMDCEGMVEAADKAVEQLDVSELCGILDEMIELAADAVQEECLEAASNLVRQAAAYIDECYFEPLTLSGLAEKYHVDNSYFSRIFRKEMGENLIHYLTRTRIEKAKEHIAKGDMNLAEVAFMVGYDDYTYFNKVFRKITGVSPREYKQNLGKKEGI
ncbi:MAG: helix-turn-helix domain-containing protein [Lachnospiraceae bacterium]|nr:helix-turn-helix domain-containing protein [Lachnospiraceae bacterium]